jgi:hypothetical protein
MANNDFEKIFEVIFNYEKFQKNNVFYMEQK